jgi:general secretion pathway protein I
VTGRSGTSGITLVEVMVAVMVLSIGTVATLRAFDAARLQIGSAPERIFAQHVALNRIAAFRAQDRATARALPPTVRFAGRNWQIETTETETLGGYVELRIRAAGPAGAGTVLVAYLPPEPTGEGGQP